MDVAHRTRAAALLLLALAAALLVPTPALAAEPHGDPAQALLTLTGPDAAVVGTQAELVLALLAQTADGGTAPVAGARLLLERRSAGAWTQVAEVETGQDGTATIEVEVVPRRADNRFRARWDGDEATAPAHSAVHLVAPRPVASTVQVTGPGRVVDGRKVRLTMRWRTAQGAPVPGVGMVKVRLAGNSGEDTWKTHRRVRFDDRGRASIKVGPRVDSRWKVVGRKGAWWARDTSPVHRLDNVPPGTPVALPKGAPRPRVALPRQARATGAGPNATVGRIPDAMWHSMMGRSWHRGCPVGRAQLRVVRVNYWGFDGYRYRGELVVRDVIAGRTAAVFSAIHRARLPIRAMYRVDRFGWSARLGGADDYRSMAAGNTSAFNCRGVVGNPGRRSPHSYGRAIDVNPWENPYASPSDGWVPNAWWVSRSHPRVAWRSSSHPMVRIMREHGFRWTYGRGDSHHFDG